MFTSVGVGASSGVAAALIVGVSVFPTILVQCFGDKWRLRGLGIRADETEEAVFA